jgi:MFS family permease
MNATAAPMALAGLGAFVLVRWLWRGNGVRLAVGALGALVVVGSLGWMFAYGTRPSNWVSDETQWANQGARASLAAVHEVVAAAGERPNILIMNYNDTADETGTNTAYGWAKTYTNVFRTGLPGDSAKYSATYLGTIQNYLAGEATTGASDGYDRAAGVHFDEVQSRLATYTEPPVVFVIGQYYKGVCNDGACGDDPSTADQVLQRALDEGGAVEVGPDVYVLTANGLWSPPDEVVAEAHADADAVQASFENHPSAWANPLHTLRVLFGVFVLVILPGYLARRFFEIDDTPVATVALVPGMSIVLTLLSGIAVLAVWRGPLTTTKGWTVAVVAVGLGAALGYGKERVLRPLEAMGGFFNRMFAVFSNRDFSVLMGVQFLAQAGQGVVQGAIAKSLAFGGEKGFDVQNLPSARYLLVVVLLLYGPYTLISPFIGVFIDRFPRRRVVWWADVITAVLVVAVAVGVLLPLGKGTTEGKWFDTGALILGLLAVQACVRVALAVKSAAIPDVLSGKDLLQGNGLSQAGGALFQIVGIVVGGALAGFVHPWLPVVVGAAVLVVAAVVAMQLHHAEVRPHAATFAKEASQVLKNIVAGVREVVGRPAAALGLSSFQMLRYQFWGFGLFVFGLYAKNLVSSGDSDTISLVLSGIGGLLGGALGLVVAQTYKDRIAPVRLLIGSMTLLGIGTLVGGAFISVAGFALMLFIGFFSFFVGKISADTIMQQTMPDDFRGRAFALFDIAYNLGYIVPALILFVVWDDSVAATRTILLVSGVVFLVLTSLVAGWSRRIRDQFAPQDDLVTTEQVLE